MADDELKARLSQIETRWSLVMEAHRPTGDAADAQRALMERYAGAIHRYLLFVTQDVHLAADLGQEFALRFLRGDFHRADPKRGRFRSYIKTAVMNLVVDAHRERKVRPQALPGDGAWIPAPADDLEMLDRQFVDCWRDALLGRAWERLAAAEKEQGAPFHTVLRFRADHPTLRSHEMAERLSGVLGREVNAGWVRQNLRRARDRFVELIRREVAHSLGHPTRQEVDEEMMNLGLSAYLRPEDPSRPRGD